MSAENTDKPIEEVKAVEEAPKEVCGSPYFTFANARPLR